MPLEYVSKNDWPLMVIVWPVIGGIGGIVCACAGVKHPMAQIAAKSETLRSVVAVFMDLIFRLDPSPRTEWDARDRAPEERPRRGRV